MVELTLAQLNFAAMPVGSNPHVVVLVEDEAVLRAVALAALEDADCVVFEFGSADEAVRHLQVHWASAHVVFTDINMPGSIDGFALAHHVTREWPGIGLLVTSGGQQVTGLPAACRFIGKPYDLADVARHIHELAEQYC